MRKENLPVVREEVEAEVEGKENIFQVAEVHVRRQKTLWAYFGCD